MSLEPQDALPALLSGLLLLGCEARRGAESESAGSPDTNVLLITIDTTRRDHLGCYGQTPSATPALDRLAEQSIVFEQAYSVCPLTLPSHGSLLTGLYPFRHGLRDNAAFVLDESVDTLAELLRRRGHQTAAFVASIVLSERYGLQQGFDTYVEPVRKKGTSEFFTSIPASEVNREALAWFDERETDRPFFAWIHYYDPHLPYDPPPPFRQPARSAYAGEIAAMDHAIGEILQHVEALDDAGALLTVLVADHGEGLGFKGEISHSIHVYQPMIHIPLLVRLPGHTGAGSRCARTVSQVDVLPTVLAALGLPVPDPVDGIDLLPVTDLADHRLVYFESYYPYLQHHWSPLAGVVGRGFKYIHSTAPELYALGPGGDEAENVATTAIATRDALLRGLQDLVEGPGETFGERFGVDADTLLQLEELGYAGISPEEELPSPTEPPAGLRTPLQNVEVMTQYYRAIVAAESGAVDVARRLLRQLLETDPHNVAALDHLARYLIQSRRYDEAEEPLEKLLGLRPLHGPGWANLGAVRQSRMEIEAAIDCYERALSMDPDSPSILYNLIACLNHVGREEEAQEMQRRLNQLR
jgi:arylsulfatase A-like enzyme